jgi:integrase/recombinase XerD
MPGALQCWTQPVPSSTCCTLSERNTGLPTEASGSPAGGLRVSEATGANIEALGVERGHRTLAITRKGGKAVIIPLASRTARAIDLAVGERSDGPVFLAADRRRLDRHGTARIVRRAAHRAGITKPVGPHTLGQQAFECANRDAKGERHR